MHDLKIYKSQSQKNTYLALLLFEQYDHLNFVFEYKRSVTYSLREPFLSPKHIFILMRNIMLVNKVIQQTTIGDARD